jgi:hypothetical protein
MMMKQTFSGEIVSGFASVAAAASICSERFVMAVT